jgi:hypothetical protein
MIMMATISQRFRLLVKMHQPARHHYALSFCSMGISDPVLHLGPSQLCTCAVISGNESGIVSV